MNTMIHIHKLPGLKYRVNGKTVTAYGNTIQSDIELNDAERNGLIAFIETRQTLKVQSTIFTHGSKY